MKQHPAAGGGGDQRYTRHPRRVRIETLTASRSRRINARYTRHPRRVRIETIFAHINFSFDVGRYTRHPRRVRIETIVNINETIYHHCYTRHPRRVRIETIHRARYSASGWVTPAIPGG